MEIHNNQIIRQPQYSDANGTVTQREPGSAAGHVSGTMGNVPASLMQLVEGQYFHGTVMDVRSNSMAQILLGENQMIRASISSEMNLNIGERVLFQVKENTGEKLVITPVNAGDASPEVISKALLGAGLPETDRNIVLVKELMNYHQPIDRESILSLQRQVLNHPTASLSSLVEMSAHDIPVSEENISQYENYKNFSYQLTSQLGQIAEDVVQLLSETAADEKSSVAQTTEMFQNLMEAVAVGEEPQQLGQQPPQTGGMEVFITDDTELSGTGKQVSEAGQSTTEDVVNTQQMGQQPESIGETEGKKLPESIGEAEVQREKSGDGDRTFQTVVREMIQNAKTPEDYKNIASFINENISDKKDLASLFESKEFSKHIKEKVISRSVLRPEILSANPQGFKERVDKMYERFEEMTRELEKALEGTGTKSGEQLLHHNREFRENMNFMGDLNQLASFVQLPVKLSGNEANADLYVYNKKRGKVKEGETLTAFLHLDLESLGATDIHVALTRKRVSIRFSLSDSASARLVEKHLDELKERLDNQGYLTECSCELEKKKMAQNPVKTIFDQDEEAICIKRYLLDIRA